MKFEKKHYIYFSTALVLLTAGYFTLRIVAQNFIESGIRNFSLKGLSIEFSDIQIKGLSAVKFTDLALITPEKDTLFTTNDLLVEVSAWKLIKKEIDIKSIIIRNSRINLYKDSINCNYCFLLNDSTIKNNNPSEAIPNYSEKAYRLGKVLFNLIPEQLELKQFDMYYTYYEHSIRVSVNGASINNGNINAQISTSSDSVSQDLSITGILNKKDRLISGKINNKTLDKEFTIPFIGAKYNANISLTGMDFKLSFPELTKSHSVIDADLNLTNIAASQPRIADTTICIPQLQTDLFIDLAENKIKIEPKSYVRINKFIVHPEVNLEKNRTWKMSILINEKDIDTKAFTDALPEGLFGPVKSIKVEGKVDYRFLIDLDLEHPDSLIIESELIKKDFRILNPGLLAKMNGSFLYTAYEQGRPVRSYIVGPENNNFTPASEVSPLLINAILQSEDGQFFYHDGFRLDAIREALIHDIKVRKFARGGSTISMQIVKNVFLDRNKNIARKLEEALIVWFIESNNITSKQRMFDVYLNIIEWGPNVYGVREAAQYYFKKKPSELTLDEAIFMASIIPRPKKFFWSLDTDGNIRESQFGHFRVVRNRLIRNGIIPDDSTFEYMPAIEIKGNARSVINKSTALPDSIIIEKIDSIKVENSMIFDRNTGQ